MQAVSLEKIEKIEKEEKIKLFIPEKDFFIGKINIEKKKDSDDEFEDYYEETQQICDGREEFPEFTNHHILVKGKEKSLKSDLKACGFPPDIIAKADEIHSKMDSGLKRGNRKKQQMFFCVSNAYNSLGIPEDPTKIARMCGISSSEISKANSMCSPSKTNFKSPPIHWEPKHFLEGYLRKLAELDIISFSDDVSIDIENICEDVMSKSQDLKDEKPQTVAAAVIVFYLQLHNCVIEKKKYDEIFSKSEMTILKIKNKVASAYNS